MKCRFFVILLAALMTLPASALTRAESSAREVQPKKAGELVDERTMGEAESVAVNALQEIATKYADMRALSYESTNRSVELRRYKNQFSFLQNQKTIDEMEVNISKLNQRVFALAFEVVSAIRPFNRLCFDLEKVKLESTDHRYPGLRRLCRFLAENFNQKRR